MLVKKPVLLNVLNILFIKIKHLDQEQKKTTEEVTLSLHYTESDLSVLTLRDPSDKFWLAHRSTVPDWYCHISL